MKKVTYCTALFGDPEKQTYYNYLKRYKETGLEPDEIEELIKLLEAAVEEIVKFNRCETELTKRIRDLIQLISMLN